MRTNDDTLIGTLHIAERGFPIPAKYKYTLIMPTELFIILWEFTIVDFVYYNISNIINYREQNGITTLSFISIKACNDVQIKSLEYLVKQSTGKLAVIRVKTKNLTNNILHNGSKP
jgi:hypothetical protein